MTDETFKNAIFGLFVILLILIGIYFFNSKNVNNKDLENTAQVEETQERTRSRVRKKVVKKTEEPEENSESEQLKELYKVAFQNVFNNGIVTCYGYLDNGENVFISRLDVDNNICYAKLKNYYEYYFYYSNGSYRVAQIEDIENGGVTISGTSMSEWAASDKIISKFVKSPLLDKDFLLRYTYILEDDNYDVDGIMCYKIKCIVEDNSEYYLYISKDSNLIMATQKPYNSDTMMTFNLQYNCNSMPIHEYVRSNMKSAD